MRFREACPRTVCREIVVGIVEKQDVKATNIATIYEAVPCGNKPMPSYVYRVGR